MGEYRGQCSNDRFTDSNVIESKVSDVRIGQQRSYFCHSARSQGVVVEVEYGDGGVLKDPGKPTERREAIYGGERGNNVVDFEDADGVDDVRFEKGLEDLE
jgi:hypothetical protein